MIDDDLILWESRAILSYLVHQYGGDNNTLYPKDPKQRALVDMMLYFDIGSLNKKYSDYYLPLIFDGAPLDPAKLVPLQEAFEAFELMIEDRRFAAGDQLTIADISMVPIISNMEVFGFDFSPYPKVKAWLEATKSALEPHGYQEINQAGVDVFKQMYQDKLNNI